MTVYELYLHDEDGPDEAGDGFYSLQSRHGDLAALWKDAQAALATGRAVRIVPFGPAHADGRPVAGFPPDGG